MKRSTIDRPLLFTGLGFLSLYGFGLADPYHWWGTHFLYFLPAPFPYLIPCLSLGLILLALFPPPVTLPAFPSKPPLSALGWASLLAVTMGILFAYFPIAKDIYGDAMIIGQSLDTKFDAIPEAYRQGLWALDLSPSGGRRTTIPIFVFFSALTGGSLKEIFIWTGIICGMGFVMTWCLWILNFLQSTWWKLIFTGIGISAPFMQVFYGHMEFYPIVYWMQLGWFILLLSYIRRGKAVELAGLTILGLLCIKVHPTSLLLLPALFLSVLSKYAHKQPWITSLLSWKGVLIFVFLPVILAGAVLYFFVFESYQDSRGLEHSTAFEHVFLPLLSPDPPLDRYNLLSFNHFFDFLNVILLWSPPALVLLVVIILKYKNMIRWNSVPVLAIGSTLLLYSLFLFMINPLLSMPMDWDLFSIPAIPLLVLTVLVVEPLQKEELLIRKALPVSLAFILLSLPVFAVNSSLHPLSRRLEHMGIHIFKTYYEWAETTLHSAVGILHPETPTEDYIIRKLNITDHLRPYALQGNDTVFGVILLDNGIYYMNIANDYPRAKEQFLEALHFSPDNPNILLKLMEVNFRLKNFDEAYRQAEELLKLSYPSERKALRIAIHCALEAGEAIAASRHCQAYTRKYPEDTFIRSIYEGLSNDIPPDSLKQLFRSGG